MSPLFYCYLFSKKDLGTVKERVTEIIEQKLSDEEDHFLVDVKILGGNKLQVFLDADRVG